MFQIKKLVPLPIKRAKYAIINARHARQTRLSSRIQNGAVIKDRTKPPSAKRFLLFAYLDPAKTPGTVQETISELAAHSRCRIDVVNIFPRGVLDPGFRFYQYDGIIIHNSVNYLIEALTALDSECRQTFRDYKGLKIMFKQDEHYRQNLLIDYLEQNPFDLVATIVGPEYMDAFYPPERLPNLSLIQYLTAYVKESHKNLPYRDIRNRNIDVGYRGSIQPPVAGMLSYEKRQIGWEFEKYARARGLVTDISSRAEDRIYGDAWLQFMGNCKAILGVESGASIVDLDGSVERDYQAFTAKNPGASDETVLEHLKKYEAGPQYRAISPRHLEAAACFAVQIMYEDHFQGIFKKDEHYIALNRDFSNVNEVIDRLMDAKERERITNNAYNDIILNEKYGYPYFVKRFDAAVNALFTAKGRRIVFRN